MTSPEAWPPTPRFAPRPRWSPRSVSLAGMWLEASVLLATVAAAAGGVFGGEHDTIPLPVPLGLRDVPALVVVGAFVALRDKTRTWLAQQRRLPALLRGVAPFVPFATVTTSLAAAAHPDPDLGVGLSGLAGLGVGSILSVVAMPMSDFAASLEADEARPWRELHVATALVTLGTLGCAARGGLVVSAPAGAFGVLMLGRGLFHDAIDLYRGRTSRGAALARLMLGGTFLLLGIGLLLASSALSLGLTTPQSRG